MTNRVVVMVTMEVNSGCWEPAPDWWEFSHMTGDSYDSLTDALTHQISRNMSGSGLDVVKVQPVANAVAPNEAETWHTIRCEWKDGSFLTTLDPDFDNWFQRVVATKGEPSKIEFKRE